MALSRPARLLPLVALLQTAPQLPSQIQPSSTPALYGAGIISTGDMELNAALTADGRTLYFTKRTVKAQRWVIVESHWRRGRWSEPQVSPFSGQYNDFDPFISPDGSRLYYSSNRPVEGQQPKRDFDIWVLDRTASGWSAPRRLDAPVNTEADEYYPSVSATGAIYFSSSREGGKGRLDVYRASWNGTSYPAVENLGDPINGTFSDGDPYISPDENTLIFVSYDRPDGQGSGDLYISRRVNGAWTTAVNLGPGINSPALEFCPIASPDGKTFFFTSERATPLPPNRPVTYREFVSRIRSAGNGFGDVYQIDFAEVMRGR
jgi:Tol biopolymer transport system component